MTVINVTENGGDIRVVTDALGGIRVVTDTLGAAASAQAAATSAAAAAVSAAAAAQSAIDAAAAAAASISALADGSAAAPSIAFAADPDTGIYRIGANNLGIAAAGAKILDIATGLVGLTGALAVTAGISLAATQKLNLDGAGGDTYITESSANVLDIYAGGVNALRLTGTYALLGGSYTSFNNTGYIRGDNAGVFTFQGGTGGYVWRNSGNGADLMTLADAGGLIVSGTITNTTNVNRFANGFTTAFADGARVIAASNPKIELWHDGSSVGQFNFNSNVLTYGYHGGGGTQTTAFSAGPGWFAIPATNKFYLDGGGNTYLVESSADVLDMYVGGVRAFTGNTYGINVNDSITLGAMGATQMGMQDSSFGYSYTYRVVQIGVVSSQRAISLGVDVSGNPSGAFSGNEIVIPPNSSWIIPTATNIGYHTIFKPDTNGNLVLGDAAGAFMLAARTGECLVGEDVGGFYYGTGFGINPALPMFFGGTGTTVQRHNHAVGGYSEWVFSGTAKFEVANAFVGMAATNKLYFDGANGAGHTYLVEQADNDLAVVVGGTQAAKFTPTGQNVYGQLEAYKAANSQAIYASSESGVGGYQILVEGRYNGYGAGIAMASRTSAGGTLVAMAKIVADGISPWNTTASTQDARLSFHTTTDGVLTEVGSWYTAGLTVNGALSISGAATVGGNLSLVTGGGVVILANNTSYRGNNAANSATIELIKVSSADVVSIAPGGTSSIFGGDVILAATKKHYLDGGGDTYIVESSANKLATYVGGSVALFQTATAIGVNTTAPGVLAGGLDLSAYRYLQVVGSANSQGGLMLTTSGASGFPVIHMEAGSNCTAGARSLQMYYANDLFTIQSVSESTGATAHSLLTMRGAGTGGGNLAIKVSPSAVVSDFRSLEIGSAGNGVFGGVSGYPSVILSANAYPSGASVACTYGNTGEAGQYRIVGGSHYWYRAASGTAGAGVTFTQIMGLDSGGLNIPATAKFYLDGVGDTYLVESSANVLDLYAGGVNALRLTTAGGDLTGALSASGTLKVGSGVWPSSTFGQAGSRAVFSASTESGYLVIADMQSGVAANRGGELWLGARGTTAVNDLAAARLVGYRTSAVSGTFTTALDVKLADAAGSAVTPATFTNNGVDITGTISTTDPAGGAGPAWKFGVAAAVSPTSPDRTLRVDIGGTSYYIAAKTTND